MGRMTHWTGKQTRPKTAIRGKRYHCAVCRKRSPRPVTIPAPWYCPRCLAKLEESLRSPEEEMS